MAVPYLKNKPRLFHRGLSWFNKVYVKNYSNSKTEISTGATYCPAPVPRAVAMLSQFLAFTWKLYVSGEGTYTVFVPRRAASASGLDLSSLDLTLPLISFFAGRGIVNPPASIPLQRCRVGVWGTWMHRRKRPRRRRTPPS